MINIVSIIIGCIFASMGGYIVGAFAVSDIINPLAISFGFGLVILGGWIGTPIVFIPFLVALFVGAVRNYHVPPALGGW